MDRRKFFKRLGLTAAVAAIAPQLLAEESAPTYNLAPDGGVREFTFPDKDGTIALDNSPKLTIIYGGGQDIECYYLEAWKKPLEVAKGVTIMFLPRQLSWSKDTIIIRDINGYQYQRIEIEKRTNVYALMIPDRLYIDSIGPVETFNVIDIDTNPEIPFGIIPE